jgi:hypothetical protein
MMTLTMWWEDGRVTTHTFGRISAVHDFLGGSCLPYKRYELKATR